MRVFVDQNVVTKVCTEIVCDRCGLRMPFNDVEWYESYRIEFTGGYGSIFGDGNRVECDLCQTCLHDLIGKFARATPVPRPGDHATEEE